MVGQNAHGLHEMVDNHMPFVVNWLSMLTYQPLPEAHQRRLAAIVAAKNKSGAARIFGCCRQTIKAAAGGLPVHPYFAYRVAEMIEKRDAEGKRP